MTQGVQGLEWLRNFWLIKSPRLGSSLRSHMVSSPVRLLQIGSLHISIWDGQLSAYMLGLVIVFVLNNVFRFQYQFSLSCHGKKFQIIPQCLKINLKWKHTGQGLTGGIDVKIHTVCSDKIAYLPCLCKVTSNFSTFLITM